MAYRTLLVHVDDRTASEDRLAYAIALARREAAELVGLYVVPGTDLAPSTAAMLGNDAVARRLERFSEMQPASKRNGGRRRARRSRRRSRMRGRRTS